MKNSHVKFPAVFIMYVLLLSGCSYIDFDRWFDRVKDKIPPTPQEVVFQQDNLFPEGIEYDFLRQKFLVSSITQGTIGFVSEQGVYEPWIDDDVLVSSLGLHIDPLRMRLLVAIGDIGVSVKSDPATINQLAGLAAYDLRTGERIFFTSLGELRPSLPHLANDVVTDPAGNAYVTDSFSGIIYKVDKNGHASVFYEDAALAPAPGAFGLNGIEYDLTGQLLVSKIDAGQLLRFPVKDPTSYSAVSVPVPLSFPDGITLKSQEELWVVCNDFGGPNGQVLSLHTEDNWKSTSLTHAFATGAVFPTTVALRYGVAPYVLYSYLPVLLSGGSQSTFKIVKVD